MQSQINFEPATKQPDIVTVIKSHTDNLQSIGDSRRVSEAVYEWIKQMNVSVHEDAAEMLVGSLQAIVSRARAGQDRPTDAELRASLEASVRFAKEHNAHPKTTTELPVLNLKSWRPIEEAPYQASRLLGINAHKRPFEINFNVPANRFIETYGDADEDENERATHWMLLPDVPSGIEADGWLSMEHAPKEGYCLGYDECLKYPFVMSWDAKKRKFVAQSAMDDEVPVRCMLIPELL